MEDDDDDFDPDLFNHGPHATTTVAANDSVVATTQATMTTVATQATTVITIDPTTQVAPLN